VPASLFNTPAWKQAIKACPDPGRAAGFLKQLVASRGSELGRATKETARILTALFSGSLAVSNWLIAHPDWLGALDPELLRNPRREQGLRREVDGWLEPALKVREPMLMVPRP